MKVLRFEANEDLRAENKRLRDQVWLLQHQVIALQFQLWDFAAESWRSHEWQRVTVAASLEGGPAEEYWECGNCRAIDESDAPNDSRCAREVDLEWL